MEPYFTGQLIIDQHEKEQHFKRLIEGMRMKTIEKEQVAIKAIQELAKTWPRTLTLGAASDGSKHFEIWKQAEPGEYRSVGKLKIRNLDEF